ncbi:MAG: hypothetical protein A2042_05940 [Candidatus Schekmanbacteria bacterium GWA2_38_11]|uniref:Sulfatase N-terminal domain-containing protein n=1 Tax=Candidatus Schekmanbacteria bacterium GWA2_38_11 TaxID=1817876 RepID=A0A1F7RKM5_9BACT|nr:MAG: hypothetical protein A2042_05940 [Candidatus Schekmanbacteria bacterium GWA2_38_11]
MILGFILLGFIIGILFGTFEIIKFTNSETKVINHILNSIYFLTINSIGFTMLMIIPVVPVCLLWNLYNGTGKLYSNDKEGNSSDKLWPGMMIYWGLYSELVFFYWGLPFLDIIHPHMSSREVVFYNLILFFIVSILGLLSFHLSFIICRAVTKKYWFLIPINFLFLVILTIFLRFFFGRYFGKDLPKILISLKFLLALVILFAVLSLTSLCYGRILDWVRKNSARKSKIKYQIFTIPKLGMISLYTMIFFICLATIGYYYEIRESKAKIHLEKNSVNKHPKKDYANIILILIDTLRADHLSCYGYKQKTSPNIDRFAKEGVLFINSFSQSSWTRSSVASLFTSLYPTQHNANLPEDYLTDEAITLAEILKSEGYITTAFVSNACVSKDFRFDQGFDFYYDVWDFITGPEKYNQVIRRSFIGRVINNISKNKFFYDNNNAKTLNSVAISWLKNNKDRKFFLYLHYMDPHSPYDPPAPFYRKYVNSLNPDVYKGNDRFDNKEVNVSLYDGEIEFTDLQIGELLKTIDDLKLNNNTLVILLSDHGEAFLEHNNLGHGATVYKEEIHVPLIMRWQGYIPGNRTIAYQACTIDIMPTILDFLNIQYKGIQEGRSLVPVIKAQESRGREYMLFQQHDLNYSSKEARLMLSLRKGEYKYITKVFKGSKAYPSKVEQLFDLSKDPGELYNIISQKPEEVKIIKQKINLLTKHIKETSLQPAETKTKVNEKAMEQMRALGYIQ